MKFRSLLVQLASESPHARFGHAAILARGKAVLAIGVNRSDAHAEVVALSRATAEARDPSTPVPALCRGATLYTLMVRKSTGAVGNGSPCARCMEAVRAAGIKRVVVYT